MELVTTKRTVYVVIALVVIGVLGFLFWRLLPATLKQTPTGGETSTGRIPGTTGATPGEETLPAEPKETPPRAGATEQLFRLTDFPVISPSLNKEENKILFYKKEGGGLLASGFDGGEQEKISNLTIVGLMDAVWSPARDRAAVFYLDGEILKGFLQIGTSSVAVLAQDILASSWSPDGKTYAYLLPKDNRMNLVIQDSSGKNPRTVFTTPLRNAHIQWITSDRIAFQTTPSGLADGFLFLFSRSSGSFTRLAGPLFGLTSLWSPDGKNMLLSFTNAGGRIQQQAVIRDSQGNDTLSIGVGTTAEKCVWPEPQKIYCAVPKTIPSGTIWPDDYLRGEFHPSDEIVLIDLTKNETETIFDGGNFDIANLLVTRDKKYLFFVDKNDGTLWRFRIE